MFSQIFLRETHTTNGTFLAMAHASKVRHSPSLSPWPWPQQLCPLPWALGFSRRASCLILPYPCSCFLQLPLGVATSGSFRAYSGHDTPGVETSYAFPVFLPDNQMYHRGLQGLHTPAPVNFETLPCLQVKLS